MTSEPDPSAPAGNGSGSGRARLTGAAASRPAERGGMILGAILVVLGLLFLAERVLDVDLGQYGWPLFVDRPRRPAVPVQLRRAAARGPGLAIAGAITTVVGLILAVQNVTDLWATWAYAWALVAPGASGLGMAVYGFVRGMPTSLARAFASSVSGSGCSSRSGSSSRA